MCRLTCQALLLPLPKLRCTAEEAVKAPESAPALLSGAASRELAERLAGSAVGPLERFAALADFFMPPGGVGGGFYLPAQTNQTMPN